MPRQILDRDIGHTYDNGLSEVYRRYIDDCAILDAAEQIRLVEVLQDEETAATERDEAKRRLTDSCIKLVVSVAQAYNGLGVPLEDLVQEGVIGLLRAAERFDAARGLRFSTYAVYWIRQAITRLLADQSRAIRLPCHRHMQVTRIKRLRSKAAQETGEMPEGQELEELMEEEDLGRETAARLLALSQGPCSLDREDPVTGTPLVDLMETDTRGPVDAVMRSELAERMAQMLSSLEPRQRTVLQMYYGLPPYSGPSKLREIGEVIGVCRERVRQIKKKALHHLRHPRVRRDLRDFL